MVVPYTPPDCECGYCDECKAEKRRLAALHERYRRESPEADDAGRELRVEWYAAIVAAGGKLFE